MTTTGTVTLHRVLKTTPEKLYRAITTPDALASWIPPFGFYATVHSMDFKVGGITKMSFTNLTTGKSESFGGKYLDIKPNKFVKYTDAFDNPNMPGTMTTSISIEKVIGGTELRVVQEGIPAMIPIEMCYLGWQESLEKLKQLVEPEIPDA